MFNVPEGIWGLCEIRIEFFLPCSVGCPKAMHWTSILCWRIWNATFYKVLTWKEYPLVWAPTLASFFSFRDLDTLRNPGLHSKCPLKHPALGTPSVSHGPWSLFPLQLLPLLSVGAGTAAALVSSPLHLVEHLEHIQASKVRPPTLSCLCASTGTWLVSQEKRP